MEAEEEPVPRGFVHELCVWWVWLKTPIAPRALPVSCFLNTMFGAMTVHLASQSSDCIPWEQ